MQILTSNCRLAYQTNLAELMDVLWSKTFLSSILFLFLWEVNKIFILCSWVWERRLILKLDCKSKSSLLLIIFLGFNNLVYIVVFLLQGQPATLETTILLCHMESWWDTLYDADYLWWMLFDWQKISFPQDQYAISLQIFKWGIYVYSIYFVVKWVLSVLGIWKLCLVFYKFCFRLSKC